MTKQQLRQYIRDKKREYSPSQLEAFTLPIMERILSHPRVVYADSMLLYHSLPDEVSTRQLLRTLTMQGKRILLPHVVSDTEMTLHPYTCDADLAVGAYGILEPCTPPINPLSYLSAPTAVSIIPGMAFSADGYRLGRGKGYYDRLLTSNHTYLIGICYPFQIIDYVPHDEHDIRMHEVIWQ